MLSLVAHFGYIGRHEDPLGWGADGHIREPGQLLEWLNGNGSDGLLPS